jgi:cell division transport system permease protein
MIGQILAQHRLAFSLVTDRMRRTPLALLMMIAVIGVTLSLPAMLYVALENLQRLAGGFQTAPQISLFLAMNAPQDQIKEIDARLGKHEGVATYRFVSRDDAWHEMQQSTGLAEIAGGLEQNPLPDAYVIEAKSGDPAAIERMQQEMQQWPGVEHAQLDAAWIKRLHGLLELGNKLVLVIAGLLGFALLIITGNSIRLQIATQREEIELSRLIGATDRFIHRPFLYAGTLYGIGGGLAALLILAGAVWLFNESVAELARLYASDFSLVMPTADVSLALVGGSALLGWIGSYLAVNRALADIESY